MTVKTILRNEVYIGHMVQNKTGTVSSKNHKQVSKTESEWIKVENTHEPLIAQETWNAVQRMDNHPARGRSVKSGTVALFGGLLRCMDCGSSMRYMRDYRKKVSAKEPEYKAYVCNRYASGGKNACSSHYINQKDRPDGYSVKGVVGAEQPGNAENAAFSKGAERQRGAYPNATSGAERHRQATSGTGQADSVRL